jgi:hypothetical protein
MQTLRKLPTARPTRANTMVRPISTGVYCGRGVCRKSIVHWYCRRAQMVLKLEHPYIVVTKPASSAAVREFSASGPPVTKHPAAMWSLPSCPYQERLGLTVNGLLVAATGTRPS